MDWSKDALEAGQVEAVAITLLHTISWPTVAAMRVQRQRSGRTEYRLGPASPWCPQVSPCGDASDRTGVPMQMSNILIYTGCARVRGPGPGSGRATGPPSPEFALRQRCCRFGASVARSCPWAAKPLEPQLNLNSVLWPPLSSEFREYSRSAVIPPAAGFSAGPTAYFP